MAARAINAKIRREFLKQKIEPWSECYLYHGTPVYGLISILRNGFDCLEGSHDFDGCLFSTSSNDNVLDLFSEGDGQTGFVFSPRFKKVLVLDGFWYAALYGMSGSGAADMWNEWIKEYPEDSEWAMTIGLWDGDELAYNSEEFLEKFIPKDVEAIMFPGFHPDNFTSESEMAVTWAGLKVLDRCIERIYIRGEEFESVKDAIARLKKTSDWDWKPGQIISNPPSRQVKSIENDGTWDPSDPNIMRNPPSQQLAKEIGALFFKELGKLAGQQQLVFISPFVFVGDRKGDFLGKLELSFHPPTAGWKIDRGVVGRRELPMIHIGYIGVDKDSRRQGNATRLMKMLCEVADRLGCTVELDVEPKAEARDKRPPMTKRQLVRFYKQFGFTPTDEGMYAYQMIRMPRDHNA